MYNHEQKERFLTLLQTTQKRKWAETLFNMVSASETVANKDIAQMTNQEIDSALDAGLPNRISLKTVPPMTELLKLYLQWAGQTGQKIYADISKIRPPIEAYLKKFCVASPSALQTKLNRVFSKESDENTDNIYRAFIWLVYIGIGFDSVVDVENEDVDLENMRIVFRGIEFPLYPESVACIKNCIELKKLRFSGDVSDKFHRENDLPRASGNKLLRTARNDLKKNLKGASYNSLLRLINFKASNKNEIFNMEMLHRSHYFYREYQKEQQGFKPDFVAVIAEEYKAQDPRSFSVEKHIAARLPMFVQQYEWWKTVFYGSGEITLDDLK